MLVNNAQEFLRLSFCSHAHKCMVVALFTVEAFCFTFFFSAGINPNTVFAYMLHVSVCRMMI